MHRHFSGNKEYKFLLAIKKKKAPRTTGLGAAVCLGISSRRTASEAVRW